MGLHEIKNFCPTKEIASKLNILPWKKIFASYTSN
jgi:hypothetical protein